MWRDALSVPEETQSPPGEPHSFRFQNEWLLACPSGALVWPERGVLMVADLHLEKGSWYAARGAPLPPYDTAETLARLERALSVHAPETVVCLGDSFHDAAAGLRWSNTDRDRLKACLAGRQWHWVLGNHDPALPAGLSGTVQHVLPLEPFTLRHEAKPDAAPGEISGHYHPKVRVAARGRRISRHCFFVTDDRVILPAFGAFTGGLAVTDPAFSPLLGPGAHALALGNRRVVPIRI